MNQRTTLAELLADPSSNSPAVVSIYPSTVISYKALSDQIESTASQLCGAGLESGEVVALVLPNGIGFLAVFLALARAGLVAAPVNPADKADEIRRFIENVSARAVVTEAGNPAVKEAATSVGRPVWPVQVDAHGLVSIEGIQKVSRAGVYGPKPGDVAMVASTSGTTGAPKMIPLSHANIMWSACNIASHYGLSPSDRGLLVLPLFHGHGLIGCSLSTLASGGTLVVPPRFSASAFWGVKAGSKLHHGAAAKMHHLSTGLRC